MVFSYSVNKENISVIKPTEIETLHSSLLNSSDLSVTGVRASEVQHWYDWRIWDFGIVEELRSSELRTDTLVQKYHAIILPPSCDTEVCTCTTVYKWLLPDQ